MLDSTSQNATLLYDGRDSAQLISDLTSMTVSIKALKAEGSDEENKRAEQTKVTV